MPAVKTNKHVVRMLTMPEVVAHFGVCETTIRNMIEAGEFPKPVRIGRRAVRWSALDLNKFIVNGCRMEGGCDVQD